MTACAYSSWLLADIPLSEVGSGACGDVAVARIALTPRGDLSTIHLPVCRFHDDIVRHSEWVAHAFRLGERHRILSR